MKTYTIMLPLPLNKDSVANIQTRPGIYITNGQERPFEEDHSLKHRFSFVTKLIIPYGLSGLVHEIAIERLRSGQALLTQTARASSDYAMYHTIIERRCPYNDDGTTTPRAEFSGDRVQTLGRVIYGANFGSAIFESHLCVAPTTSILTVFRLDYERHGFLWLQKRTNRTPIGEAMLTNGKLEFEPNLSPLPGDVISRID